ncbi:ABC transporter substrate-binding protein [Corynebacterium sp. 153RC1]|uniref:ABC transporter substrate-binding protein n=1 Tax=unclassified Corynebacterium TaxID=2624378 RepID=UPI00211CAC65|nr:MULTISPECIES: ABC transporter substrate-binding protein [unclassified Corynebacterium]MCQ9370579.1 ABC transporter substrate-binding protein [Corynebacterium sp. 35RC1]MCQ9352905.1 ABC transporter substrate-binding protein [Corynebacterium sp. 209RC1]MCQ9353875.1 ABC transporter substrate-binding protein [Corynebacterium sp. 1222RC1]MCQ9356906.1 ABC transporter substrate-binding protein [Corynebacterium sp. 122RC1]MCQ9358243.1 ABC transporter substrate-binding protein [Corynebacterium sp. 1
MRFAQKACSALLAATLAVGLSACVTNEEQGHPDGWVEISPAAVPEIAAMVPESIAQRGVISGGTNPPFAPFEFKSSDGAIIGAEMDLARALASVMGLEFTPLEQDFSLILPALSGGTVDMGVSGFTDNEERRKNYDFINTLYAGIQWGQRIDDPPVSREDACGLTVAVQRTTVSETDDVRPLSQECVDQGKEPIEVLSYETSDQAATALVLGRADAFSADSPVLGYAIERADGKLTTTGEIFDAAPYGIAVPKDSPLGPALAAAMQHLIESGDYARIMDQWGITEGLLDQALINEVPYNQR